PGQAERVLEEGPLPFLFRMRAAEAKRRYHLVLGKEDEKGTRVEIYPLESLDRSRFSRVDVLLDRERCHPTALRWVEPNEKDTQTYPIRSSRRNEPVDESLFAGAPPKGWRVVRLGADRAAAPSAPETPP